MFYRVERIDRTNKKRRICFMSFLFSFFFFGKAKRKRCFPMGIEANENKCLFSPYYVYNVCARRKKSPFVSHLVI